jgi:hypothetical protein
MQSVDGLGIWNVAYSSLKAEQLRAIAKQVFTVMAIVFGCSDSITR